MLECESAIIKIIWSEVLRQEHHYSELQIFRGNDGQPRLEFGPRMPEIPE